MFVPFQHCGRTEPKNIRIVKKSDMTREIQNAEKGVICYPSLNEINFIAYGHSSEEYHNELYGALQETTNLWSIAKFDKELLNKWKCPQDRGWFNSKSNTTEKLTIHSYIRNCIHHPENTFNQRYTDEELERSIKEMRNLLSKSKTTAD